MRIKVTRSAGGYEGEIISDDGSSIFKTTEPQKKERLSAALYKLGFHQRDIIDALAMADRLTANTEHPLFEAHKSESD